MEDNTLIKLRKEIDAIDSQLKELLIKRMDICLDIAAYKKRHNLCIEDEKREEEILKNLSKNEKYPNLVSCVWKPIMEYSKNCKNKMKRSLFKEKGSFQ